MADADLRYNLGQVPAGGLFDQPADVGGIPVKMIGNLREAQGFVKILVDKGFYLIDKDVVGLIVHAGGLLINAVQPG